MPVLRDAAVTQRGEPDDSSRLPAVIPKEREWQVCTVVVCSKVMGLSQTSNPARLFPPDCKCSVEIGIGDENVTEDGKGRHGWICNYFELGVSSRIHSYFPSSRLVPFLTERELGDYLVTPVFDSSSPEHLLLLQVIYSELCPQTPNNLSLCVTKLPLLQTPNHLAPTTTPNHLDASTSKLPLLQTPNYLASTTTPNPP